MHGDGVNISSFHDLGPTPSGNAVLDGPLTQEPHLFLNNVNPTIERRVAFETLIRGVYPISLPVNSLPRSLVL